jgi:hypothetical protein
VRVSWFFFSSAFFTASLMVSSCFVQDSHAGEQVAPWSVGSAVGNRAVSRSDRCEGVVKMSCVVCRRRCFLCRRCK